MPRALLVTLGLLLAAAACRGSPAIFPTMSSGSGGYLTSPQHATLVFDIALLTVQ